MTFINEKEKSRTIDHERGFILTCLGGGMPESRNRDDFELIINDTTINFFALHKIEKDESGKIIVNWLVQNISPSNITNYSEQEIQKIITEALSEYCMFYDRSKAEYVNVTIENKE